MFLVKFCLLVFVCFVLFYLVFKVFGEIGCVVWTCRTRGFQMIGVFIDPKCYVSSGDWLMMSLVHVGFCTLTCFRVARVEAVFSTVSAL